MVSRTRIRLEAPKVYRALCPACGKPVEATYSKTKTRGDGQDDDGDMIWADIVAEYTIPRHGGWFLMGACGASGKTLSKRWLIRRAL